MKNLFLLGFDLGEELFLGLLDLLLPGGQTDLLGVPPLLRHVLLGRRLVGGIGADGGVRLLVHLFDVVWANAGLDEPK